MIPEEGLELIKYTELYSSRIDVYYCDNTIRKYAFYFFLLDLYLYFVGVLYIILISKRVCMCVCV